MYQKKFFCANIVQFRPSSEQTDAGPAPRRDIPGPCPSKSLLVPSQTRIVSPKRGSCTKESNRLGAAGVQFQDHSKIREQELFFAKNLPRKPFFVVFTPEFVKIRACFGLKTFFGGGVFTPEFVKFCDEDLCILVRTGIRSIQVFVPPKIWLCPPSVT